MTSDHKADIHKELYLVSEVGDIARVRELLEAGADPNQYENQYRGLTALHRAARIGHNEVVKTLIQAGADVNGKNHDQETALHEAAGIGHNKVVKTLIQAKCDVNALTKVGETALHWAAVHGHRDVVISLLENGADPHLRDNNGKIPGELTRNKEIENILMKTSLERKFDEKLHYNLSVSIAIVQGHHECVLNFLEKVPSSEKKGIKDQSKLFSP